jgi:down-regulator of transcription 1
LENLGIPEEELLRQQQELFAKAREEQAAAEQQQWFNIQANAAQQQSTDHLNKQLQSTDPDSEDDDY